MTWIAVHGPLPRLWPLFATGFAAPTRPWTRHQAIGLVLRTCRWRRLRCQIFECPTRQGGHRLGKYVPHRLMVGAHFDGFPRTAAVVFEKLSLTCLDDIPQGDLRRRARKPYPPACSSHRMQDPNANQHPQGLAQIRGRGTQHLGQPCRRHGFRLTTLSQVDERTRGERRCLIDQHG